MIALPDSGGETDIGESVPRGTEPVPESDFEAFERLKGRVVTARSAYACCRNSSLRSGSAMVQLAAQIRSWYSNPPLRESATPVPNLMPLFFAVFKLASQTGQASRIAFVPVLANGAPANVILGYVDLPSSDGEMDRMEQVLQQPAQQLKRTIDQCWRCVTSKMLPQRKARRTVRVKFKDGSVQKLQLRIPHK